MVPQALLILQRLRLGEEVVQAAHDEVNGFNFEFVFTFLDLVDLITEEGTQG